MTIYSSQFETIIYYRISTGEETPDVIERQTFRYCCNIIQLMYTVNPYYKIVQSDATIEKAPLLAFG